MKSNTRFSIEKMAALESKHPLLFGSTFQSRFRRTLVIVLMILFTLFTFVWLDFNPLRIFLGIGKFFHMLSLFFPPNHGGWFNEYLVGLGETLAMAFLGTLLGFLFALPLSFIAAKNVNKNKGSRLLMRRFFDFIRGINTLIWALMFVHVVGLGPFAGIMAIFVSDLATLGKLFSEAIENVDINQIEGTKSTGANGIQIIRFAYIPQVLPIMLSNALYFFESNVRSASILGVLGAGGIGLQLWDRIRVNNWKEVCFIIIMLLVTIAIIDVLSKKLRDMIMANQEYRP
ncbi:MAG: phosphonate ABC transporter, permease protein PhnE [Spirochaetales bacterium]|nr:phosphonate ABC transporter, permease protein PhnE [Spirochaetales bacterium]